MSNNVEGKAKQPATEQALTPKLRFPEFRDAGAWAKDYLGKIADFVSERMPLEQLTLANYVSTENILPDYEGIIRASKLPSSGSATRFKMNDILVSNIRPYLRKIWFSNKDGGASNDVIVIRSKEKLRAHYLSFALMNDAFIRYVMKGAKGVKMPRGDVLLMREYPLTFPSKLEQQKIADCLSSLDELITAEAQKRDTLRAYKKGLMQQLFPSEGETLPKLRFPEFLDAGEWEERKAGALFANRLEDGEEGLPIYSVTMYDGMVKRSSLDRRVDDIAESGGNKKVRKGDIAYNMMRMWQGAFGVSKEDCMVSPAYVVLSPERGACPDFFGYLFKLSKYLQLLTSHSQGLTLDRLRLYYKDFARIPVLIPSPTEQQKIADCLSSLDELIAAQTQKLELLKVHKKGLMQQLFPALDEVNA